ncbi:hypothetical protein BGW37DRAFT_123764 [Umbelopsis sp. PMI_123]|nr:hypothetical protein BGW37DRAFT_123764 [Umbelopsis sp. PMI_123]
METTHTTTSSTGDSQLSSSLNPNASAFTPSAVPQPASPQQSGATQAFKPHVKYCYYEQFGQCTKGDACPFAHRSQEQCWYEANGGCKRGAACLFKHTGIKPTNNTASPAAGETKEDKDGKVLEETNPAEEQANFAKSTAVTALVMNTTTPMPKKSAGPTLNTAMLEAKLSNAKKSTIGGSAPNNLVTVGNGLASHSKTLDGKTPAPIPTSQPKPATTNIPAPGQGISLKGTAKLALANAAKANANVATGGKPMSALRAAALASVKSNTNGPAKAVEAKLGAKRGDSPAAATIKQAVTQGSPNPNNKQAAKQAVKQTIPAKQTVTSKQGAAQVSPNSNNKQAAAQSSPNLNNKQTAKKTNVKSPAGTEGGLDNIKILTFEEIMAQKRAKKEAEQASASTGADNSKTRSPRSIPPRPATPVKQSTPPVPASKPAITTIVERMGNTPQLESANKANQKSESVLPSANNAQPGNPGIQAAAVPTVAPAPVQPIVSPDSIQPVVSPAPIPPVISPATTTTKPPVNNTHSNGNSQIGTKRTAEPSNENIQPPMKKPAVEQVSKKAVGEETSVQKPTVSSNKPPSTPPSQAEGPATVTSQKRGLDASEEAVSNKKQAVEKTDIDADDELAQFEAEFGELDDLEGGDIKDFDEESIMKELKELEEGGI